MLEQGTVRSVTAGRRSGLGEVRQVAAGEEGRAEGERRLQTAVLLGRGDLEERRKETVDISINRYSRAARLIVKKSRS